MTCLRETTRWLFSLIREQKAFERAPEVEIDLPPMKEISINWWTFRKAGFDCLKPYDAYRHPQRPLSGKLWRLLVKGAYRIPVIRKHLGKHQRGNQHLTKLAAYSQLLEVCEIAKSPFGVLMFADSYDSLVLPNTPNTEAFLKQELPLAGETLRAYREEKRIPPSPTDNRCSGCHFGYPQRFQRSWLDILRGKKNQACPARGENGQWYHSPCGNQFHWTPPHEKAIGLGIAQPQ